VGDGTFSVATAICAPASAAEVFRVLLPGGRFVIADPQPARTPAESAVAAYGVRRMGEADYRRMLEDAGFTELVIRVGRGGLFAHGRKPATSHASTAVDPGSQHEPANSAELA
jgi:hypothetical protein